MQACPDDDVLVRAASGSVGAELETHLDACGSCRQVLAAVVSEGQPPSSRRIDRYEVERTLGAGGMGVVYAARDPKLHRMVAVKVLRGTNHERMQREARVMAQLAHPHVVNVYDTGESDGRVYVAMELLGGGTLRSWMSQRHSLAETLRIFRQAGEGLVAAHDAGIVHRDFKPENVLLGADGRARVTDFGLANFVPTADQLIRSDGLHTGPVGTLAYMAPEQLEGAIVDARADQFAFCVSLYEAVSGRRPELPPEPLDVPFWPVLERGLSQSPSRRFGSMRELLAAFDTKKSKAPWLLALIPVACVAAVVALDVEPPPTAPLPMVQAKRSPMPAPAPRRQVEQDVIVEPARDRPLPKFGTVIFLPPGGTRTFDVGSMKMVRIADPDIADVDVNEATDELTLTAGEKGRTDLTLELGGQRHTWPVEVRPTQERGVTFVALHEGDTHIFRTPGVNRVTVGDSNVVNIDEARDDFTGLHFKALKSGTTNAFVWTESGERYELRFDITSFTTTTLTLGLQQVLTVTNLTRATVSPATSCEAELLGPDELLLIPQSVGSAVLTLERGDGSIERRELKIVGK